MNLDVYCPECGGENVEIKKMDIPKKKKTSMDDLPVQSVAVDAIDKIVQYQAKCTGCGHAHTWTAQEGWSK